MVVVSNETAAAGPLKQKAFQRAETPEHLRPEAGHLQIDRVAIIGVPIVLTYTVSIYYVFRGKVTLTEESY
jgi:hypothetical protein